MNGCQRSNTMNGGGGTSYSSSFGTKVVDLRGGRGLTVLVELL